MSSRFEPDPIAVGRDIDGWCTRCKMDLAHTIVAMVDVKVVQARCNTCHSVHKYHVPKSGPVPPGQGAAKTSSERVAQKSLSEGTPRQKGPARATKEKVLTQTPKQQFDRWATEVDTASDEAHTARTYSMHQAYWEGELVRHDKFGLGKVLALPSATRVVILFRDGEKTLVCVPQPGDVLEK
ncbi:MAG: hypothetical protein HUU55_01765 [Myxococcales bacterium]|nr:hypothetical protein [Myxococcales bacterium]